jgi:hypothetical protein
MHQVVYNVDIHINLLSSPLSLRNPPGGTGRRSSYEQHPGYPDREKRGEKDHAENRAEPPVVRGGQITATVVHGARSGCVGRKDAHDAELQAQLRRDRLSISFSNVVREGNSTGKSRGGLLDLGPILARERRPVHPTLGSFTAVFFSCV